MTLLDTVNRDRVWATWMRENTTTCAFTKTELRSAIDAVDQWVEDNTASYNTALPTAFRTTATTPQKIAVLGYVLWRRLGRLRAAEDS